MDYGVLKSLKHDKARLKAEIEKIPDPFLKRAFYLKFIDHMTWTQTAFKLGSSAESLRKACGRLKW
jgi:hypothetical protein